MLYQYCLYLQTNGKLVQVENSLKTSEVVVVQVDEFIRYTTLHDGPFLTDCKHMRDIERSVRMVTNVMGVEHFLQLCSASAP